MSTNRHRRLQVFAAALGVGISVMSGQGVAVADEDDTGSSSSTESSESTSASTRSTTPHSSEGSASTPSSTDPDEEDDTAAEQSHHSGNGLSSNPEPETTPGRSGNGLPATPTEPETETPDTTPNTQAEEPEPEQLPHHESPAQGHSPATTPDVPEVSEVEPAESRRSSHEAATESQPSEQAAPDAKPASRTFANTPVQSETELVAESTTTFAAFAPVAAKTTPAAPALTFTPPDVSAFLAPLTAALVLPGIPALPPIPAPPVPPLAWAFTAWTRRNSETARELTETPPADTTTTAQSFTTLAATGPGFPFDGSNPFGSGFPFSSGGPFQSGFPFGTTNPFTAAFDNQTPTATYAADDQDDDTGVITGTIAVTDPDNTAFKFSVTKAPTKGTVSVDENTGAWTYTPEPELAHDGLTDSFEITVSDETDLHMHAGFPFNQQHTVAVPISVTVTPINKAPVEVSPTQVDPPTDSGSVRIVTKFTDPDGDPLSYVVTGSGSDSLTHVGTDLETGLSYWTYLPSYDTRHAAAAPGGPTTETIVLTVSDGRGGSTPVTLTVGLVPVNADPEITAGTPDPADHTDGSVTGTFTVDDDDEDDTFTYTGTAGSGTVDVSDGTFTYTPTAAARHNAAASNVPVYTTVTITVDDGHGGTDEVQIQVQIDPSNTDPIQTGFTQGDSAAGTGTIEGTFTVSDTVDGDPITYSHTAASNGTVTIDPQTGNWTYTPTAAARDQASGVTTMTDTFTLVADDGHGGQVTKEVTVTVRPAYSVETTVLLAPDTWANPWAVTTSPDGKRVYVTLSSYDRVSVIDAETNTVVDTIQLPSGSALTGVVASLDGKTLYVSDANTGRIYFVNLAAPNLLQWVSGYSIPYHLALSPDGKTLYVASNAGNSVIAVDVATGAKTSVSTGISPWDVALDSDGTVAYVANSLSNTVSVVDTATNTVTATIPVGSKPLGVAVSPDDTLVYVTNEASGSVTVIDTATNTVVQTITGVRAAKGVVFAPDGKRAYVTSDTTIVVIDVATGTVITKVPLGLIQVGSNTKAIEPYDIAISPDGKSLYVVDIFSRSMTVVDIDLPAPPI